VLLVPLCGNHIPMGLEDNIPELKQEHRDLLTLLRAAINL
jgi:hypothetical protein